MVCLLSITFEHNQNKIRWKVNFYRFSFFFLRPGMQRVPHVPCCDLAWAQISQGSFLKATPFSTKLTHEYTFKVYLILIFNIYLT